jgi:hypothetical protein
LFGGYMKPSVSFIAAAVLALGACGGPDAPVWHPITLAGAELHDVADCAGVWYAAGSTAGRPAAWTSADGRAWQPLRFAPLPTSYYGPRETITHVACASGRVAMIGAVPGGAHGNPRVSTWRRLPDGRMAENPAPFETYGGDTAVDVDDLGAGPAGFAIGGNRSTGAAAWFSADGATFTLVEDAPGLAGDTVARDAVALPDGRWMIVGGRGDRAAAWAGPSFTPADPPAGTGFAEVQRAVRQGDDVVAAGMRGTAFGLWRWHAGTWTAGRTFGGDPGGVRSLTVAGGHTVVAGGGLWIDGERIDPPAPPVAVAGRGDTLLLAGAGGLWLTNLPGN